MAIRNIKVSTEKLQADVSYVVRNERHVVHVSVSPGEDEKADKLNIALTPDLELPASFAANYNFPRLFQELMQPIHEKTKKELFNYIENYLEDPTALAQKIPQIPQQKKLTGVFFQALKNWRPQANKPVRFEGALENQPKTFGVKIAALEVAQRIDRKCKAWQTQAGATANPVVEFRSRVENYAQECGYTLEELLLQHSGVVDIFNSNELLSPIKDEILRKKALEDKALTLKIAYAILEKCNASNSKIFQPESPEFANQVKQFCIKRGFTLRQLLLNPEAAGVFSRDTKLAPLLAADIANDIADKCNTKWRWLSRDVYRFTATVQAYCVERGFLWGDLLRIPNVASFLLQQPALAPLFAQDTLISPKYATQEERATIAAYLSALARATQCTTDCTVLPYVLCIDLKPWRKFSASFKAILQHLKKYGLLGYDERARTRISSGGELDIDKLSTKFLATLPEPDFWKKLPQELILNWHLFSPAMREHLITCVDADLKAQYPNELQTQALSINVGETFRSPIGMAIVRDFPVKLPAEFKNAIGGTEIRPSEQHYDLIKDILPLKVDKYGLRKHPLLGKPFALAEVFPDAEGLQELKRRAEKIRNSRGNIYSSTVSTRSFATTSTSASSRSSSSSMKTVSSAGGSGWNVDDFDDSPPSAYVAESTMLGFKR